MPGGTLVPGCSFFHLFCLGFVRPADPLRVRGNLLLDFKKRRLVYTYLARLWLLWIPVT